MVDLKRRVRKVWFYGSIISLLLPQFAFTQDVFPVADLKPGMIAVSKTVFQGDKIEEFEVEIVDVMKNFYPNRDVIIVRLKGEKATFAGPTRGMSGSPVYIDGKILGALAYGFTEFPKDPIMGVTPISEMLEIIEKEELRPIELIDSGNIELMERYLEMANGLLPLTWENFKPASRMASRMNMSQQPLTITMGGFSSEAMETAGRVFAPLGMQVVRGATMSDDDIGGELVPGAPVSAVIVGGDYNISASGTVTYRSGNKVLAFGHPFFDNGPVEFPMARARVLATLSSSYSSSKMFLTGKIVGTLKQDRTTGVFGEIGPVPRMTEIALKLTTVNGERHAFNFTLSQEKTISSLSPLYLRIALINALKSARLVQGFNTLRLKGYVETEGGDRLELENLFPGYQPLPIFSFLNPVLHSTGEIAAKMAALANNPYKSVRFRKMELNFESIAGRKSATLRKVWVNKTTFEPGDSIQITCRIKPHHGEARNETISIRIPETTSERRLAVIVGGAGALAKYERRVNPAKYRAPNYDVLLDRLKSYRRNDQLYIQVRAQDRGVMLDGKELNSLPPSVYAVMATPNKVASAMPTRSRVVLETAVPQQFMIEGVLAVMLEKK